MLTLITCACLTEPMQTNSISLSDKDNGSTVTITSNETFSISLPSTPGTGYSWHIQDLDKIHLELLEERLIPKQDKLIVGAQESQLFRFKAISSGQVILQLDYSRPWEPQVKPLHQFRITIVIH